MPICADHDRGPQTPRANYSFEDAHDAGLAGLNETVLAIAADDGRLLVSHDVSTMPQRFARCLTVIAT